MGSIRTFIAVFFCAAVASVAMAFIDVKSSEITAPDKGFAVVELFTSEGCSSCPPADALVARLQKEDSDKPVYILAFHVDYWDRLGWKDAFSNASYSGRQKQYAHWLKLSSVYTPQIVVNGHTEFVGSEESSLRNAIKAGLQKPVKNELALSVIKMSGDKVNVQYNAGSLKGNASLLIALIEKSATTKVERGENGGRTLSHVQIVTKLQSVSLKSGGNGNETIALPHAFIPEKWELIGFVQNTSDGEIIAAAKTAFPSAMSADAGK